MKFIVTIFVTCLIILVILAFVGIEPFSSYKDSVTNLFTKSSEPGNSPLSSSTSLAVQPPQSIPSDEVTPGAKTSTTPTTKTPSPPPPKEASTSYLDATSMVCDWDRNEEHISPSWDCLITVSFMATASIQPGYFEIELYSNWHNYGAKQFKYLRGDLIKPQSWLVAKDDSVDTWIALTKTPDLGEVFKLKYAYKPFVALKNPSDIGNTATLVEETLFNKVNQYRVSLKQKPLVWNQTVQSATRDRAYLVLKEGTIINPQSSAPYVSQIVTCLPVIQGETTDEFASRLFFLWVEDSPTRLKLINDDSVSMAIGVLTEIIENKYYIVVLFSSE
jgi:uncharacterized protein YkwD